MKTSVRAQIAGAVFVLAILALVAATSRAQQAGAGAAGTTAAEANDNIQVLTDLPADQLNPTMRFMSYSLGVECAYCHVGGNNASDERPAKVTARAMMRMTMALNKDNFNGRPDITCYVCHRGVANPGPLHAVESTKIIPGGTPPPPPAGGGGAAGAGGAAPAAAAAGGGAGAAGRGAAGAAGRGGAGGGGRGGAQDDTAVDEILAKYAQAIGGEQALRRITNRTITGVRDTAGRNAQETPWVQARLEQYEKAPNLKVMIARTPNGQTTSIGFDGTSAWTQNPNGQVTEARGVALARVKRMGGFYWPLDIKTAYSRLGARGREMIDNRETVVVTGNSEGDTPDRLFFDAETGLLRRHMSFNENMIARSPTQTDFLDYKEFGGIKYPSTIKVYDVMATPMYIVTRITKVDLTTPVDASKFTKPVSRPPAGRGGGGAGAGGGRGGGGAGRGGAAQ